MIKEITELKVDIKQKTKQIVEMKELVDSDSANEVQEIPQNIAMNREATKHKCNACNKIFRKSNDI